MDVFPNFVVFHIKSYQEFRTLCRYLIEATIFSEDQLANVTGARSTNVVINNEENNTQDADEIMEDATFTQREFRFSKAEICSMECQLSNPKDVWNEFAFIDNSNFDFS